MLLSLIILFSFSLSVSSLLSADPSSPEGICVYDGNQGDPRVYGSLVVWEDWRNGDGDIYQYDLEKREEMAVCAEPGNQTSPDIWGDIIVWYDDRPIEEGWEILFSICAMNITSGERWVMRIEDPYATPRVYENIVLFSKSWYDEYSRYGLVVRDLSSGRDAIIPTYSMARDFDIYGKNVVYTTYLGLYLYNLEGRKETTIIEKERIADVEIWEDRVVWIEGLGDEESTVWLLDLKSGKRHQIMLSERIKGSLELKGDRMAWCEFGERAQIVFYDMENQSLNRIDCDGWIYGPSLSDDYVVWMEFKDWRESLEKGEFVGSGWDIYGCKI